MIKEEATEIIEEYENWKEISCSCHISPPCSKCTDSPSEEDYREALLIIKNKKEE